MSVRDILGSGSIFGQFKNIDPSVDEQVPGYDFEGVMDLISKQAWQAEVEDNLAQSKMAQVRKAIVNDDAAEFVGNFIREVIKDGKQKKLMLQLMDTTANIIKMVVNIYKIYSAADPTRNYTDASEETKQLIERIYKDAEANERLDMLARDLVLLNDVLVLVTYDPERKKINLEQLDRENAVIISNDRYPNEIEKLYYDSTLRDENGAQYKIKYVYTKDSHYYIIGDNEDEKFAVPGNPEMINPLGVIPIVSFHRRFNPRTYWNSSLNNDLFAAYFLMCFFLTCKNYSLFMNAFKMIFLLGVLPPADQNGKNIKITMGPGEVAVFPNTTTGGQAAFHLADFTVDFNNLWAGIRSSIMFALQQFGLNANDFEVTKTQSPEAGVALVIKKSGELVARKELIPIFQKGEAKIFDIIRLVWNYYAEGEKQIPETVGFEIIFPEIENFANEKEKYDTFLQRVKDGIMHIADFYMSYNPSCKTREEAMNALEENKEAYKEIMGIQDYLIEPGKVPKPEYDEEGEMIEEK